METINETPFVLLALRTQPLPPARALTVILKATFERDGEAWKIADKQRDLAADTPHMDDIGRSLAWASDLAPVKTCSDFFVLGSFHQPGGVPATEGHGAIQLGQLRKELAFYGVGYAGQLANGSWMQTARAPMVSVPLRWEFSYGGLSDPRNPMGRGIDKALLPSGREMALLPQIEYPEDRDRPPGQPIRPANFAPVPLSFLARSRRQGTRDRHWSVFRAPLPPQDFDPRYHNAAPDDQQASDFCRGDETLILVNLHPEIPELTTTLPGLRPRVGVLRRLLGVVTPQELPMRLDTVVALPDEDQLVLTWRGVIELSGATEQGEIEWLQARVEPLAEPSEFEVLAAAMLDAWNAAQPKKREAPQAPSPRAPPDISATMGEARKLFDKMKLPAELRQTLANESNPEVVFTALSGFIGTKLAAMEAKYKK